MDELNLLPISKPIKCKRNSTRRWQATLMNLATVPATPINLAGQIVRLIIKPDWKEATTAAFTQDATIIDAANGVCEFEIPAAEDLGAVDGSTTTLYYEISLIAGSDRIPWWDGPVVV